MKVLSHIRPEETLPKAMENPAQVLFIGIDISSGIMENKLKFFVTVV